MSAALLQVSEIDTFYGGAHILHGLSLQVGRGEVVALMGRNGAGKSTTLKSVIGLVRPARGTVTFEGRRIDALHPFRIARMGLGYVPEERRIFTDLTVAENLQVGMQPPRQGHQPWTAERLYHLFPNLAEMRGRRASQMSGGEQQMLTVARTLMGNPAMVLLDEPSEGLAPVIVDQMAEAIVALKQEGLSVLLSEQNLYFASDVSDRAYVIESGFVRFEGAMRELAENDELRRAYLTV